MTGCGVFKTSHTSAICRQLQCAHCAGRDVRNEKITPQSTRAMTIVPRWPLLQRKDAPLPSRFARLNPRGRSVASKNVACANRDLHAAPNCGVAEVVLRSRRRSSPSLTRNHDHQPREGRAPPRSADFRSQHALRQFFPARRSSVRP